DASQKVFLKILDLVPALNNGEHYRRILCRVAFQVALDEFRAQATRRQHERRKSEMAADAPASRPEEDMTALQEHLARLPEETRGLLVDHYFEGKSLEEIARRQGCSKVAVWKRLDRARADLRWSLSGAGLAGIALGMQPALEARVIAPAPRELVTSAIIERTRQVAHALTVPAVPSGGGLILAGRSLPVLVGIAILMFAVLGGGAVLVFRFHDPGPAGADARTAPVRSPHAAPFALAADPAAGRSRWDPALEEGNGLASAPKEKESLLARLVRFRDQVREARGLKTPSTALFLRIDEESEGLRSDVLASPGEFVAFFRAPENAAFLRELLSIVIAAFRYRPPPPGTGLAKDDGEEDPPLRKVLQAITKGMCDLLQAGSKEQKTLALPLVLQLRSEGGDAGQALLDQCISLLGEQDNEVSYLALLVIQNGDPERLRDQVDLLATWLENLRVRGEEGALAMGECLGAIASLDSAKSDEILLKTLEGALARNEGLTIGRLALALSSRNRSLPPENADRTASLLGAALAAASDPEELQILLQISLSLPLTNATPLLHLGL
ncbi:MAG TPA: sigma-70 family RNA polymerase sigma factor, partial [Planctomycetota bacterium]|nr:sigma-70 family RNA polymerase sigma factor [Planctomycetota bacterium]